MSNLLKAEFYKLFHSWYFWGIGLFNLLLSSVLLLDSVGETSNLFFASIYNMPILYFLTIIFSALFVGNDFGRRTLQSYINAGHRRGKILFAKLVVHQIACMVILSFPLLLHSIIGTFVTKGALASIGIVVMVIASQFAMCLLPFFFAFIFRDIGKSMASSSGRPENSLTRPSASTFSLVNARNGLRNVMESSCSSSTLFLIFSAYEVTIGQL